MDDEAVTSIAGALTAASLTLSCYEWRLAFGRWDASEATAFACAAYYLSDLVGFVYGQDDFALDMITPDLAQPFS